MKHSDGELIHVSHKTTAGFWLYLMTDCLLFATLFATYVVLRPGTADGPSGAEIFQLPMILVSTVLLLTSSLTSGFALIAVKENKVKQVIGWLVATYILGLSFLTLEIFEFAELIAHGHGWQESAFLSAFFVLVGTHGLHILIGLLWLVVLVVVLLKRGLTPKATRQLSIFGMYWHFLDLVWIFIFTIVYLMGVL